MFDSELVTSPFNFPHFFLIFYLTLLFAYDMVLPFVALRILRHFFTRSFTFLIGSMKSRTKLHKMFCSVSARIKKPTAYLLELSLIKSVQHSRQSMISRSEKSS